MINNIFGGDTVRNHWYNFWANLTPEEPMLIVLIILSTIISSWILYYISQKLQGMSNIDDSN